MDTQNNMNMASREQYWDELSIENKIEKIKSVLEQMNHTLEEVLATTIDLSGHSHLDGRAVIPFGCRDPIAERSYRRSMFNNRPR